MNAKIRLFGKVNGSIVDGTGFRYTIFTQGCNHNCKGCHNTDSHDFLGGKEYQLDEILEEIKQNPMLSGITLSGGEPLLQAKALLPFAESVISLGLNIWIYTGYTFEELIKLPNHDPIKKLLSLGEVLVDGPFILEQRSLDLSFKGSRNQRIINLKKSLASNSIVLMDFE